MNCILFNVRICFSVLIMHHSGNFAHISLSWSCVRLPDCNPSADAGLRLEKELKKMEISVEKFTPFSYLQKVEEMKHLTEMYIKDSDIEHMKDTMVFASPKHVILDFVGDPDDLTHLDQLLKLIIEKECTVELKVWHHFTQPSILKTTDSILTRLLEHHSRLVTKGCTVLYSHPPFSLLYVIFSPFVFWEFMQS